jgi:hypothetical protein
MAIGWGWMHRSEKKSIRLPLIFGGEPIAIGIPTLLIADRRLAVRKRFESLSG